MNRHQRFTAQIDAKCGAGSPCVQYGGGSKSQVNVGNAGRILSTVAGGVLVKRNLGRLSLSGLAKLFVGAALLRRGITGHCDVYEAMNVSSAKGKENDFPGASEKAIPVRAEMTVEVPPLQAYQLWRDPANQEWMMGRFARVNTISSDRARWKLRGPFGLEWEALVVADLPGEFIRWESLPGAGLPNEGSVRFEPTETGGTRIQYEAHFDPPSTWGLNLLKVLGMSPESIIGRALYRFKSMAEMTPTRLHGPRRERVTAALR